MNKHLIIWLFSAALLLINAQSLSFKYYSSDDGLAQNSVYAMLQDSKGYIWIGTEGGLSKFDGVKFVNYTKVNGLPDNHIRVVFEDDQNNIWIGTNKGLVSYKNGKLWSSFQEILGSLIIYSIIQNENEILIATSNGLFKLNLLTNSILKYESSIGNISFRNIDKLDDKFIFATEKGMLTASETVDSLHQEPIKFLSDTLYSIFVDSRNRVWVGSELGVDVYTYNNNNFIKQQTYKFGKIFDINEDISNNIWVSTFEHGIYRVNAKQSVNFSSQNGLTSNDITSILIDTRGDLWFGS